MELKTRNVVLRFDDFAIKLKRMNAVGTMLHAAQYLYNQMLIETDPLRLIGLHAAITILARTGADI